MTELFSPQHGGYGIPDGASRFQSTKARVFGYTFDKDGRYYAIIFPKNGKKPMYYKYAATPEKRGELVERIIDNRVTRFQETASRRKENSVTTLVAGDILYTSWGYEQTNVEFYKVLRVLGKQKVELVEIGQKHIESDGYSSMACMTEPDPDRHIGEPFFKMARKDAVRIHSSATAWKHDGKPKYKSWYH